MTSSPVDSSSVDSPDWLAISAMRALTINAVQAAESGHPGAALALAPVGYTLWNAVLRYDVEDTHWLNRDRFVLSVGHASMLLYSLLHLARVKQSTAEKGDGETWAVPLGDIRRFRQLGSVCAGHPEFELTPGVECTTGPLSTGVATSVGMAIAGKWLAERYNKPDFTLFDFDVYALAGDGCMMEGLSQEAASLASHLKLDNLCWIYDSNRVTIEGPADLAFSEDVGARFRAYGWRVIDVRSADDLASLRAAFRLFQQGKAQPTLIIVESIIGIGAPTKQGTSAAHSEPLGDEEGRAAKRYYNWPEDAIFQVPDDVYQTFAGGVGARGQRLRQDWNDTLDRYRDAYPELTAELHLIMRRELPQGWDAELPEFEPDAGPMAGRVASQQVMNAIAPRVPWLLGGASDLAPSTKTRLTFDGAGDFQSSNYRGRNLHFGVREAAAAAAANGMALSGLRPFQAGFLVFSDFQRAPLRLSALMKQPVLHIYTHDSIGMGEDGPTHQPVEHLASIRAMPDIVDLRPADPNEIREAWRVMLAQSSRPVALILYKQEAPVIDRARYASARGLAQGGYVLADTSDGQPPEAILIATGTEVVLAIEAHESLAKDGISTRVVSLPSWKLFEEQDVSYREQRPAAAGRSPDRCRAGRHIRLGALGG